MGNLLKTLTNFLFKTDSELYSNKLQQVEQKTIEKNTTPKKEQALSKIKLLKKNFKK